MSKTFEQLNNESLRLEKRLKHLDEQTKLRQARLKDRAHEIKARGVAYLGGKCQRCGNVFPNCVYDFHHRNPKHKEKNISSMIRHDWERIVKELDKCDLLCSNCHRIIHYE